MLLQRCKILMGFPCKWGMPWAAGQGQWGRPAWVGASSFWTKALGSRVVVFLSGFARHSCYHAILCCTCFRQSLLSSANAERLRRFFGFFKLIWKLHWLYTCQHNLHLWGLGWLENQCEWFILFIEGRAMSVLQPTIELIFSLIVQLGPWQAWAEAAQTPSVNISSSLTFSSPAEPNQSPLVF